MKRIAKTYKLSTDLIERVHKFCDENGLEYSFFIAKAMEEKLVKEIDWLKNRKAMEAKQEAKHAKTIARKIQKRK